MGARRLPQGDRTHRGQRVEEYGSLIPYRIPKPPTVSLSSHRTFVPYRISFSLPYA